MRHLAVPVVLLVLAGCNPVPPPPGPYAGPEPTAAAQNELRAVIGNSVTLKSGPLAGAPWQIEGYSILTNDVSPGGRGPVIRLRRGGRIELLPMVNDADVADLRLRALGVGESDPAKTSAAYRSRIGR